MRATEIVFLVAHKMFCRWHICKNVMAKHWTGFTEDVATPLWPSVRIHTPKVGDLESSGTPECLEFDKKGKKTSP
jgi:hypothetical protein